MKIQICPFEWGVTGVQQIFNSLMTIMESKETEFNKDYMRNVCFKKDFLITSRFRRSDKIKIEQAFVVTILFNSDMSFSIHPFWTLILDHLLQTTYSRRTIIWREWRTHFLSTSIRKRDHHESEGFVIYAGGCTDFQVFDRASVITASHRDNILDIFPSLFRSAVEPRIYLSTTAQWCRWSLSDEWISVNSEYLRSGLNSIGHKLDALRRVVAFCCLFPKTTYDLKATLLHEGYQSGTKTHKLTPFPIWTHNLTVVC